MRLSVILTNYNDSSFLPRAVKDIFEQSLPPDELIIVDDGSTDNSVIIAEQLARQYPSIRLVKTETNMGIPFSLRRGLEEAGGDFIFGASCNDAISPGHFELGVKMLEQYPQAAVFFADSIVDDRISGIRSQNEMKLLDAPGYLEPESLAARFNGGVMQTNTVISRRDKLLLTGAYLPELKWHCDWWTFSLLALNYGACYAPQIMGENRVDPHGYSSGVYDCQKQSKVFLAVLQQAVKQIDVLPLMKKACLFNYFLYVCDVVRLNLLLQFLKEAHYSNAAVDLVMHLLKQKLLHKCKLVKEAAYKVYFNSFQFYRKKKIMLLCLLGAGSKKSS